MIERLEITRETIESGQLEEFLIDVEKRGLLDRSSPEYREQTQKWQYLILIHQRIFGCLPMVHCYGTLPLPTKKFDGDTCSVFIEAFVCKLYWVGERPNVLG